MSFQNLHTALFSIGSLLKGHLEAANELLNHRNTLLFLAPKFHELSIRGVLVLNTKYTPTLLDWSQHTSMASEMTGNKVPLEFIVMYIFRTEPKATQDEGDVMSWPVCAHTYLFPGRGHLVLYMMIHLAHRSGLQPSLLPC